MLERFFFLQGLFWLISEYGKASLWKFTICSCPDLLVCGLHVTHCYYLPSPSFSQHFSPAAVQTHIHSAASIQFLSMKHRDVSLSSLFCSLLAIHVATGWARLCESSVTMFRNLIKKINTVGGNFCSSSRC